MAIIHAHIRGNHYATRLQSPTGNTVIADEPLSDGGSDLGFSPSELLASSLATCTCVTLRMYADHKGWPLEEVLAEVNFSRDKELNVSNIERNITLVGPELTPEQRQRLLQVANTCYIHKTLTNPINIHTQLTPDTV